MESIKSTIKYALGLLGLIFGAIFVFRKKPESVKVDDTKVNEEIKQSEKKVEELQDKIDNLKVEDKTLEEELNYWKKK